jgi:hypothetical protein
MKTQSLLFLSIFLFTFVSYAQWQPDVRLTNNSANSYTSFNYQRCLEVVGDTLHSIWSDDRDGNYEIYYKRSTNNGLSWLQDTRLTYDTSYSYYTSISAVGSIIHVVWQDRREGNWDIFYKRSTNGGMNWVADINITNDTSISMRPCLSANGPNLHLVYMDYRDGNYEIYYKNSSNNGINWSTFTRLTYSSAVSLNPCIALNGSNLHLVWYDERDGNPEIYYKNSTNSGISWDADTRLTNNISNSWDVSISVLNSNVYVAWDENGSEIFFKSSNDNGLNWNSNIQISNTSGHSSAPIITTFNSQIHLVWVDDTYGNYELLYKTSYDMGSFWGSETRLTNSPGMSINPSIAVYGTNVHLIWYDERDGNPEIYYKRNPTGNIVFINNNNSGIPKDYLLEQNFPNPFNPETKIKFHIPKSGYVSLEIYDALGRRISTIVNENLNAGEYEVEWNALSQPSGVYFYRITASVFSEIKKMVLVK